MTFFGGWAKNPKTVSGCSNSSRAKEKNPPWGPGDFFQTWVRGATLNFFEAYVKIDWNPACAQPFFPDGLSPLHFDFFVGWMRFDELTAKS
jgi:hypothetical protein